MFVFKTTQTSIQFNIFPRYVPCIYSNSCTRNRPIFTFSQPLLGNLACISHSSVVKRAPFNPDLSFLMSKPMEHPREDQKQHLTSSTRKRGQILMGWKLKHTTSRRLSIGPVVKG